MIDFTSRQLRAFMLVAKYRSFSRAASAMFITPSGLSLLIRELETQLGARLFDRTTRHVALNPSGSELLAAAQRNLQELDAVMSHIQRSTSEATVVLSVAAPPVVMASILAPAIREFRRHQPDVRFQLFDEGTTSILQKVEARSLDIGFSVFFKHFPGTRRTPLFRFTLILIRPDMDPAVRRTTSSWSSLRGEKIISLPASLPLQQFIDKQLALAGITYQPVFGVNYLNTQIALVEAGQGIAIIPSYGVPACQGRRILTSRLINPVVHLDFSEVRNSGRRLPAVAGQFTSFLQTYIATWAGRSGIL